MKIIKGNGGLFVAMPSKRQKDGGFRDIVHPLDRKTRSGIEKAIFKAYQEELQKTPKANS